MAWVGAAIAAGAAIIGGMQQADSSSALSKHQMSWQKHMSDTAHRRQVVDLRAAGLNPILSARYGGSSTPAGSMPSQQPNILGRAAASALAAYTQQTAIKKMEAETKLTEAATTTEGYKWQDIAMATRLKGHQANLTSGQINLNTITQILEALRIPGMTNEADLQQAVGPALKALGPAGNIIKLLQGLIRGGKTK